MSGDAIYSAEDYLAAAQRLLPRGRVWPTDPDSVQTQAIATLVKVLNRVDGDAQALLVDAFPATTENLLPEWEATLGLPDPCAGEGATIAQRRAQVVARFIASGGQSIPYYVSVAAALGYTITITEFSPFHVGDPVGQPIYGDDWAFAWQINAPEFSIQYFEVGTSVCGEPLSIFGNTVLQCELERIAPAHTILLFSYS